MRTKKEPEEETVSENSKSANSEDKSKFLEALAKKKGASISGDGPLKKGNDNKTAQNPGTSRRLHRRKSG